jgi:hypothetical protein
MDQVGADFLQSSIVFISEELGEPFHTGQSFTDIKATPDGCAGVISQSNDEIAHGRETGEVFEDNCFEKALTREGFSPGQVSRIEVICAKIVEKDLEVFKWMDIQDRFDGEEQCLFFHGCLQFREGRREIKRELQQYYHGSGG